MFTLRVILVTCVCVWGGGMCKCPIMFVVCMQDPNQIAIGIIQLLNVSSIQCIERS